MDLNTIIQIGIALFVGGFSGFITSLIKVGKYTNKVDTLENDVRDLKREVREIRDKVIACETSLKEREPLTKRESPISLTDKGNKTLKDSGAEKFIDDNFDSLFKKIEGKHPKAAYDIQEISKNVLEDMQNDDLFNDLKEYAFKEGREIEDIILVAGIHLRDKVLMKKGLNIKDIDKDDPNVKKPMNKE